MRNSKLTKQEVIDALLSNNKEVKVTNDKPKK
mgnify:CR=1 FL=1